MNYAVSTITANEVHFRDLLAALGSNNQAVLDGVEVWGRFFALFGLPSNALNLVTYGEVAGINERLGALDEVKSVSTTYLQPTARPTEHTPRTKEGLYVFRWFHVKSADVDRVAELSQTAWTTFEVSDSYDAIPQALFCESDLSKENGYMLLVTWYDGLNSWQTSRKPAPEASRNFQERAKLTSPTTAFATRLIRQ